LRGERRGEKKKKKKSATTNPRSPREVLVLKGGGRKTRPGLPAIFLLCLTSHTRGYKRERGRKKGAEKG